jgi:hypothetical protein
MKLKWIILFFIQSFSSSAQQSVSGLTETFAFSVKSIDEFIGRFNYDRGTEFEKYFQEHYAGQELTRPKLLLSLFNYRNKSFAGNPDVKKFIEEVSDSLLPQYINFSDRLWYAELECKVIYNSTPRSMALILRVEEDQNRAFKWTIVSADADFLGTDTLVKDSLSFISDNEYLKNRINDKNRYFLHPVSHALGFMNIDVIFSYMNEDIEDYVYEGKKSVQLENLIAKVKKHEIEFIQVNAISYHFLQIKGWIAIVDYFNNNDLNSGWLINTLINATNDQKSNYLKKHLNVVDE